MRRVLLSVAVALVGLILAGMAWAGDTRPGWWASAYYPASYYGKTTGTDSQQTTVILDGRPFNPGQLLRELGLDQYVKRARITHRIDGHWRPVED